MKLRDNWRLGFAPIRAKKWRHALIILTMGLVLGVVMALVMGIAGLEQAVRSAEPKGDEPAVGQVMDLALSNVKVTSALDLFLVAIPVKTPMTAYEVSAEKTFGKMWGTYTVVIGVLLVAALIITMMTLVRLLGQEAKNQKLYQAKGATPGDLRRIYGCYTLILGVLTCVFGAVLGVGLTVALSIAYAEPLTQVFELAYDVQTEVWLIGWNWRIPVVLGLVLVVMVGTGMLAATDKR